MTDKLTAVVLGSTGLVGKALVSQLLTDKRYDKVIVLVRRPLPQHAFQDSQEKLASLVVDFEQLADYQGYFHQAHVYVCIGTTIKQAKSQQAFRQVDFTYVHLAAQLARDARAKSFVWISSVGANANSGNFYLRVKGELENAIFAIPGKLKAAAVQPSLLLGERSDKRFAEQLAINTAPIWSWLCVGPFAKYKPIGADQVAAQMINLQDFSA